jgi:hypothetical protein
LTPGEYEVIAMADGYEPLAKLIAVTDHGHTGTIREGSIRRGFGSQLVACLAVVTLIKDC